MGGGGVVVCTLCIPLLDPPLWWPIEMTLEQVSPWLNEAKEGSNVHVTASDCNQIKMELLKLIFHKKKNCYWSLTSI